MKRCYNWINFIKRVFDFIDFCLLCLVRDINLYLYKFNPKFSIIKFHSKSKEI